MKFRNWAHLWHWLANYCPRHNYMKIQRMTGIKYPNIVRLRAYMRHVDYIGFMYLYESQIKRKISSRRIIK